MARANRRIASVLAAAVPAILCAVFSGTAQDVNIINESRGSLTTSRPINEKFVLYQYTAYETTPAKGVRSFYYSPPGVIYKANHWLQISAELLNLYNANDSTANSWELRPTIGVKVLNPNKKRLQVYNYTRFEYRFINQNHNTTSQPRLRSLSGVEVPLKQGERAWHPKTFYALADIEPIWRLDDNYLTSLRVRGGLGYIFSKKLRAEFTYHANFTGTKGEPKHYTENIWRLNLRLNLPRADKHHEDTIHVD